MSEPIFRVRNVKKSFGDNVVLENFNLDIQQGEIIGVIGGSGAGKTTFLHTLIGFIKPDEGDIEFRLNHLLSYKSAYVYKSVYNQQKLVKKIYGFASQVPSFYDELTPNENLEYFGMLYNLDKHTIKSNKKILLDLMELEHAADIPSRNLSGGMERRLDIACALMHDPDVLILDEPTADLDPVLRSHIWDLMRKINKKGTTIILSSHHLSELEELCDRVIIIKDGAIVAQGEPEVLKKKYVTEQEIILQTEPGNYDMLRKEFLKKKILNSRIDGKHLRITTKNPEQELLQVISILKSQKEKLKTIKVAGASLDDVFIKIWEKK
jgi:ABC-2 type transport system ATP-binding protein